MAYQYSLISAEEALRGLKQESASEPKLPYINDALTSASQEIQDYLERVVIQEAWIEYHERSRTEPTILRIKHWPISSISEIAEDSAREYGATTLLTVTTDYQVIEEGDQTTKIRRVSGESPTSWESGFEAIRVKVTGGWTLANVPPAIRRVCREYLARQYHAAVNQEYAFSRISDARGDVTHFGPVMLTRPQLNALANYKDWGATTCVRFALNTS